MKLDEEVASGRCRELLGCFHPRKLSALVEREQFKALDHFSSKGDEALKRLVFSFPRVTVPSEERRGVAGYGDGPVPPDRFRWRDIEVSGITTKPFRLLTLLWEQRPQGATLDQVCRAVWLDENVDADWNLVRN
ncbi:MAG TPA: hypothetical protein VF170_17675, partial [Planctomycetaceae bacterium]